MLFCDILAILPYACPIIFNWSIVLLWKMIVSLKIVYQGHSIFEVHCLTNWSIVLLWKWYSATNWMLKFNLFLNSEIWYMQSNWTKKCHIKGSKLSRDSVLCHIQDLDQVLRIGTQSLARYISYIIINQ